jgi:hypothetical protein
MRAGQIQVTTTSKKGLPKRNNRSGVILNHISGGEVTVRFGNDITVEAQKGIIINSSKSALVLDDGSAMYQEEMHVIGAATAVLTYHEIGPVS